MLPLDTHLHQSSAHSLLLLIHHLVCRPRQDDSRPFRDAFGDPASDTAKDAEIDRARVSSAGGEGSLHEVFSEYGNQRMAALHRPATGRGRISEVNENSSGETLGFEALAHIVGKGPQWGFVSPGS